MGPKIKFSVGYNHDLSILDCIHEYIEYLSELYFPIPVQYLGSGRSFIQKNKYSSEIYKIINFCNKHNIKSTMLVNPTCEGKLIGDITHMNCIAGYIEKLHGKGLKSVILVNPLYVELVKERIPEIEVQASVNCFIDNLEKAQFFEELGVSMIIPHRDINHDLNLLKKIKNNVKSKLKIMVNEGCIFNCITRNIHFNYIAHQTKVIRMKGEFCRKITRKKPELIFKSPFIRPEDLKHYSEVTNEFKISTRAFQTQRIHEVLKAYTQQRYDGNLLDLIDRTYEHVFESIDNKKLDEYNFFETISNCGKECKGCDYCKKLLDSCCVLK